MPLDPSYATFLIVSISCRIYAIICRICNFLPPQGSDPNPLKIGREIFLTNVIYACGYGFLGAMEGSHFIRRGCMIEVVKGPEWGADFTPSRLLHLPKSIGFNVSLLLEYKGANFLLIF